MATQCTDILRALIDDVGLNHVIADVAGLTYCMAEQAEEHGRTDHAATLQEVAETLEHISHRAVITAAEQGD